MSKVGRIAVVGPAADLKPAAAGIAGCEVLEGKPTPGGNFFLGLRYFADSPAVLFITADAPLVTADAIADFLQRCRQAAKGGGEVFLAFAPHRAFTGAFRGTRKPGSFSAT